MKKLIAFAAVLLWIINPSMAMFAIPTAVPITRLVKNAEAQLEKNPDDSNAYYTLGRIHYLAFFNRSSSVPVFEEDPPRVAPDWHLSNMDYILIRGEAERLAFKELGFSDLSQVPIDERQSFYRRLGTHANGLQAQNWKPERIPDEVALSHAVSAKTYLEKAIALNINIPIYHLGLASLYEQVLTFLESSTLEAEVFSHLNKKLIADIYWNAFEISVNEDSKLKERPLAGLNSLISFEAGNAWIRLGIEDAAKKKSIESHLKKLSKLKYKYITPLVITDNSVPNPRGFVRSDVSVSFDLDGHGNAGPWEWVTSDTAFLVWDPTDHRSIVSGVQLFGNYTFQIFWSDGFKALSSLDDNGDGAIDGSELDGLSLWHDRNSNGISESNEVKPIYQTGITSFALSPTKLRGGMKVSIGGVIYSDGTRGHLWDWISKRSNKSSLKGRTDAPHPASN